MTDTKVIGIRELYEALSTKIPRNMEGKVLQKALARGTLVTKKQVEANIGPGYPFPADDTGTLRRSVYHKRSKFDNSPTFESRIIGIRHGRAAAKRKLDAYYATWVEFGHRASPGKGKRLMRESRAETKAGFDRYEAKRAGGLIKGEQSKAFVAARPFMRPAFESTKERALAAILDGLAVQLDVAKKGANW